jgi:hypothetical protein
MTEIKEKKSTEAELEERVRELEEENQGLKKQLLEYQYKTGEKKKPLDEKNLVEYLDALNDPEKVEEYKSKKYIVAGATIADFDSKLDPCLLFCVGYLYIDVLDQKGNTTRFTDHLYNRKKKEDFVDKLEKLRGTEVSLVVSTDIGPFGGKYHHFDKIITKKEVIDFDS